MMFDHYWNLSCPNVANGVRIRNPLIRFSPSADEALTHIVTCLLISPIALSHELAMCEIEFDFKYTTNSFKINGKSIN